MNSAGLSYDINNSKVLLVGVSNYFSNHIRNLPNVEGNLKGLKAVFCDPILIGFPESSVIVLNSPNLEEFKKSLHYLVKNTKDTLFLYYSGHGMYYRNKIYYTFHDTDLDYMITTAIEYEAIKNIIKDGSTLLKKVLIFDSCYSGNITDILSDFNSTIDLEFKSIEGAYIITSSASNKPSKSIPGKGITEFTESLISVFKDGVSYKYEYISDEVLFEEVKNKLQEKNKILRDIPSPRQYNSLNASFILSRNPKYNKDFILKSDEVLNKDEKKRVSINDYSLAFYNWLRNKDKSVAIEEQKEYYRKLYEKMEYANIGMFSSINYAKRIQSAMLPDEEIKSNLIIDSFVIFEPRDIVSGDFYWIKETEDRLFIAAADCTGHGVPGAFITVLGLNILNNIIVSNSSISVEILLNELRTRIINSFSKSKDVINDGLDIAVCSIHKDKKILEYSGAYNPLFYFQNNEFKRINGDRMPIGNYSIESNFIKYIIPYNSGDTFYIFSDGFKDQFGGPQMKKFKISKFREVLTRIQILDMKSQKELLINTLKDWKGNFDQVDDILVVGFKVS
jgi:serine phosphatase RsbU (regulator of sigma subunit)